MIYNLALLWLTAVGCTSAAFLRNVNATASPSGGVKPSALRQFFSNTSGFAAEKATASRQAPCQCLANDPAWVPTTRTVPKCIFIDLGAAHGNTFEEFLQGKYGVVQNCPSGGKWEAFLVEANPQFTPALTKVGATYPGLVHPRGATAAYMCQGETSFNIDPDSANNHWGSSMKRGFGNGAQMVTVPTMNVMQLIATQVIQADWVMLKVDVEGAEYDILPCMAQSGSAHLVDRMYLEEHGYLQANSVYTQEQYNQAKVTLQAAGIDIPQYFSKTF